MSKSSAIQLILDSGVTRVAIPVHAIHNWGYVTLDTKVAVDLLADNSGLFIASVDCQGHIAFVKFDRA